MGAITARVDTQGVRWWLVVAVCLIAVPRLGWAITENALTHGNDFGIFFRDAHCLSSGACQAYQITTDAAPNLLSPHGHLLFWPLLSMPMPVAWTVWMILSFACVAVALAVSLAAIGRCSAANVALGLALVACSSIGMATGRSGQLYAAMTLPLALAWVWRERRQVTAAAIIGVLATLKPLLLVFLPWFLWRRQWKTAASLIVFASLACALGLIAFGGASYTAWLHSLEHTAKSGYYLDGSILQTLLRVFGPTAFFQPVAAAPTLAATIAALMLLTVAGVTLWRGSWLGVTTAAFLLSPKGWIYGGTWMVALATGAWPAMGRTARRLLIAAGAIAMLPAYAPLYGQPNLWLTPTLGSMVFWMFVLVWISSVVPAPSRPASSSPR